MTAPGLRFGVLAAVSTRRAKFAPEFSGAGGFVESCAKRAAGSAFLAKLGVK